jgi:hypothetical protein
MSKNLGRKSKGTQVAVVVGATSKWQADGRNAVDRRLRIMVVRAHAEGAAGNADHAGRRGGLPFQRVHHFISNG